MKLKYTILGLILCVGCTQREDHVMDKTEIQKEGIKFHEVEYGIGTEENARILPDSLDPTGKSMQGDAFYITAKTDTIPAKIGTEFGVKFNVEATAPDDIELTKIWLFPQSLTNPVTHKQYDRLIKTLWLTQSRTTYTTYKLEDSFELVKGDWKLRIYYKHHLLYSKHFWIQ
ncbi:MAG: DUF3859 domain-containing protein [Flavipsychrobacter sp.]|nr:DUF3859 domain-containing protein [Flavipsychrobacter sp.]